MTTLASRACEPIGSSRRRSRSLRAIEAALAQSADGRAAGSDLMRELLDRRRSIDPETASLVLQCVTGLLAVSTGKTPRSILEAEFVSAPSDEFWRADLSMSATP